jgi:predicted rRNA methylase YqxC with S4 and FtsJ domains
LAAILAGRVFVDGRLVTNPRSLVRSDAAIVVRDPKPLRGETKLATAVRQLDRVVLASDAQLLALVKPMFELRLDHAPRDTGAVREAFECAAPGFDGAGWRVCGHLDSPIPGARGAVEVFLHARRASRG